MEDREEEHAGRGHGGRDVAQDEDLGRSRALGAVAQTQRHAPGLERGAHRPPHVHDRVPPAAPLFVAQRGETALELRHRLVHRRQVLGGAGRKLRSSSASGRDGGASRCARSAPARARVADGARRLIPSRSIGGRSGSCSPGGCGWSPSVRRMRWTSTPTTPEPSPRRPNAAIASRARSRISPRGPRRSPGGSRRGAGPGRAARRPS